MTNFELIKEIATNEEKLIKLLSKLDIVPETCTGVCETENCPYFRQCKSGDSNCMLSDEEQARIWLGLEAKETESV